VSPRAPALAIAALCFGALLGLALLAPEHLSDQAPELASAGPGALPPFGADTRGRPLLEYAAQGARITALRSEWSDLNKQIGDLTVNTLQGFANASTKALMGWITGSENAAGSTAPSNASPSFLDSMPTMLDARRAAAA
jgi:hypothetical protein